MLTRSVATGQDIVEKCHMALMSPSSERDSTSRALSNKNNTPRVLSEQRAWIGRQDCHIWFQILVSMRQVLVFQLIRSWNVHVWSFAEQHNVSCLQACSEDAACFLAWMALLNKNTIPKRLISSRPAGSLVHLDPG